MIKKKVNTFDQSFEQIAARAVTWLVMIQRNESGLMN
jgi:hypothetical protein